MSTTHAMGPARTVSRSDSASHLDRIAGISGLAFALIVLIQNLFVGAMSPPQSDASADAISSHLIKNHTALAVAVGVIPFAMVALYIFLGSAYPRLSSASSESAFWTRVGTAGLVLVGALFLTFTFFNLVLIANAESLAAEPALIETLWQLRGAVLIVNGLTLAVTLLGLSRAARLSGLIPAWHEALGLVTALAFFVAAVASVPALEGSAVGLLGFAAFMGWLFWLALTSIRFLRTSPHRA